MRTYCQRNSNRRVPYKSLFATLHRGLYKKSTRCTLTSRMLAFNGRLGKFLPKKASSKKWNIILPQVHELFPETPLSINPPAGALYMMEDCIHFIYNVSSHWNQVTTTSVLNFQGGIYKKALQTETSKHLFSSLMRLRCL